MPKAPSSRRYAQAVFEIALEGNAIEDWSEDLEQMQQAIGQREFAAFLESTRVPLTEKYSAIEKVLPEVRRLARNLLSLLVTRGAFRKLPEIIRQYHRLSDVHRGIERGEVLTAVEVPDHLIERAVQRFTESQARLLRGVLQAVLVHLSERAGGE